ncbi:putative sodium-dependent multivitamin transporter [Drosophila sulfurigaster albostrigata]|uniref:putative sodium-dependent multivitamin transporter n=1 Tax=Drosophila sulfurigaster albostrigata TaxID=89887 RepID=UPI002D21C53C|nr:putative sodium-dependent multivitamin transporter [Drosophila sulfurigaster albostrigata]
MPLVGSLGVWDVLVLASILIISALIGLYYRYTGGKQKTTQEYLMANQSMTTFPVSFSLMASFMSAITLMGVSNESYQFGTLFGVINISYVLSTPIAAYIFLPVFYNMRTTSVYEYLERRFGHATRLAASLAFTLQMILYMGIALYAPALALEAVTGIPKGTAILVLGLVCSFYSTVGGLKAVLITDVFQSFLMYAAIFAVITVSAIKAGGLAPIWEVAQERGRVEFFEFSTDPTVRHTWWTLIIGGMVTYLSLYGVNQTQVQRLLSVHNLKSSQSALWWNLPILGLLSFSTIFSGLAIFYYYRDCDPVLEGRIKTRDQLMPLFAVDTISQYPGLCGLFVSGIFSASLSTISSAVTSLSAVTLEDYLKPLYRVIFKRPLIESKSTLPTKIIAAIFGLMCIALAFGAGSMGGVLQASLTIFGVVGGPLLAIFTLGVCTVRTNQRGVLLGFLLGLGFSFWIGFGSPKPMPEPLPFSTTGCVQNNMTKIVEVAQAALHATSVDEPHYFWLYRLSYLWYCVLGFLVTTLIGYFGSLILAYFNYADNSQVYVDKQQKHLDYDLFAPILANRWRRQHQKQFDPTDVYHEESLTKLSPSAAPL